MDDAVSQLQRQNGEQYTLIRENTAAIAGVRQSMERCQARTFGNGSGTGSIVREVEETKAEAAKLGDRMDGIERVVEKRIAVEKAQYQSDREERLKRQAERDSQDAQASRRTRLLVAVIGISGPALTVAVTKFLGAVL